MPFRKGRAKTGGRVAGAVNAARKSKKFVEQLKGFGFNYPRELAETLLDIRRSANDSQKLAELKFYYTELKSLLPFMAPKLREKEVEVADDDDTGVSATAAISTDDLLEAFGNEPKTDKGSSSPHLVGARSTGVQAAAGPETDLQDVAGIEVED